MMAAIMFQGPPFLKVGGSLGPHLIILDPSLRYKSRRHNCDCLCWVIRNHK